MVNGIAGLVGVETEGSWVIQRKCLWAFSAESVRLLGTQPEVLGWMSLSFRLA